MVKTPAKMRVMTCRAREAAEGMVRILTHGLAVDVTEILVLMPASGVCQKHKHAIYCALRIC
jgi:hypothetical protein